MASTARRTEELVLTQMQQIIIDQILEDISNAGILKHYYDEYKEVRILLRGYAGTGKTVTTAALVSRLVEQNMRVVVATPTHKARAQVQRALRSYGASRFETATIHSLLGLKKVRNLDTGIETFEADLRGSNRLRSTEEWSTEHNCYVPTSPIDIVIVDECSMLHSELYRLLLEEAGYRPVIFVGDNRQLLPVGEDSPCRAFVSYTSGYALTSVLRHDGAILNLATRTRELTVGRAPFVAASGGGTHVVTYADREQWIDALLRTKKSRASQEDPDFCRALAWTNRTVENLNKRMHHAVYGLNAPEYVEGMTCLTVDAIPDRGGSRPLLYSTTDVLIVRAIPEMHKFETDPDLLELLKRNSESKSLVEVEPWATWRLTVVVPGGDAPQVTFRVIAEESAARWRKALTMIRELAKAADKERRQLWRLFFERKDSVGRLQPASALTIHKSQGSTFQHVFLHWEIDGWREKPTQLHNQLAYVGITRASSALHVLADQ